MKFNRKSLAVVLSVIAFATMAYATATLLTVTTSKLNNYPVIAGDLNVTPVAMDNVNGNSFVATGKETLVFLNTDTVTHTITVTSITDAYGRLDTSLTGYVVPVATGGTSGVSVLEMSQLQGWQGAGSLVTLTSNSALIKIMVLRHP